MTIANLNPLPGGHDQESFGHRPAPDEIRKSVPPAAYNIPIQDPRIARDRPDAPLWEYIHLAERSPNPRAELARLAVIRVAIEYSNEIFGASLTDFGVRPEDTAEASDSHLRKIVEVLRNYHSLGNYSWDATRRVHIVLHLPTFKGI